MEDYFNYLLERNKFSFYYRKWLLYPQYSSLQLCREQADVVLQMYEDGYTPEETVKHIISGMGDVETVKSETRMAASFW